MRIKDVTFQHLRDIITKTSYTGKSLKLALNDAKTSFKEPFPLKLLERRPFDRNEAIGPIKMLSEKFSLSGSMYRSSGSININELCLWTALAQAARVPEPTRKYLLSQVRDQIKDKQINPKALFYLLSYIDGNVILDILLNCKAIDIDSICLAIQSIPNDHLYNVLIPLVRQFLLDYPDHSTKLASTLIQQLEIDSLPSNSNSLRLLAASEILKLTRSGFAHDIRRMAIHSCARIGNFVGLEQMFDDGSITIDINDLEKIASTLPNLEGIDSIVAQSRVTSNIKAYLLKQQREFFVKIFSTLDADENLPFLYDTLLRLKDTTNLHTIRARHNNNTLFTPLKGNNSILFQVAQEYLKSNSRMNTDNLALDISEKTGAELSTVRAIVVKLFEILDELEKGNEHSIVNMENVLLNVLNK